MSAVLSVFVVLPVFGKEASPHVKQLEISSIENEQTHELSKQVVRVAYQHIGYDVIFADLPARRALEWANAGKTDGDLARIDGTEQKYTNLIKLSTPVTEFEGVAFTKKIKKNIQSWKDLTGLSVGIIGGIRYSDIGTKGLDRIEAKDMTQLFTLLLNDHIDVAIAVRDAGLVEIHRHFAESGIYIIGLPLYSAKLFHFIHKKNIALIPQLEATLKIMMDSGEIKAIREKTLQEMLSQ